MEFMLNVLKRMCEWGLTSDELQHRARKVGQPKPKQSSRIYMSSHERLAKKVVVSVGRCLRASFCPVEIHVTLHVVLACRKQSPPP